ncbi:MAG: hypothetical protein JXX14_06480 [Deltaproteobacteria bacterium]|nr:hypothetical protein [Deltaproteobacteria bacterium]
MHNTDIATPPACGEANPSNNEETPRLTRRHGNAQCIIWLILIWLVSMPALSKESASVIGSDAASRSPVNFPRVMLIVFEDNSSEVLRVVENLQLRLFELDIKFGIRWIQLADPDIGNQTLAAQSLMTTENLQLVFFWKAGTRDMLYFLDTDSTSPITRRIDDVGEESRPEAISIVVQTTIESLLESNAFAPPTTPRVTPPRPRLDATVSMPAPPSALPSSPPKSRRSGRVYLQTGYELDSLNSQPTLLHTVNFRLGFQPVPLLRSYLGLGISSHLSSRENDFETRQNRLPIELGGLAMIKRSALIMGGGAALLIVPQKNTPGSTAENAYMRKSYWSSGVMTRLFFECQYRISRNFEFFANIHLLINMNMVSYNIENGPVLFDEFRRLWPGFQVGITFFLF